MNSDLGKASSFSLTQKSRHFTQTGYGGVMSMSTLIEQSKYGVIMKKSIFLILVLSACTLINACGSDAEANEEEPGVDLEIDVTHENSLSSGVFTGKGSRVIHNQEEYEELLLAYNEESSNVLDFSEGRMLLVDMGQRNTGGYSINVENVIEHDEYVIANVVLYKPGEYCIVTLAFTNPFKFVWIPSTKEILINESLETYSCNE